MDWNMFLQHSFSLESFLAYITNEIWKKKKKQRKNETKEVFNFKKDSDEAIWTKVTT